MSMSYGIVYEIICLKTNLRYIGQTVSELRKRWNGHLNMAFKKQSDVALSVAIREHGPESFQQRVLCECESKEELDQQERRLIKENNTVWPNGYNMTNGGEGPCELTRQKISQRTREAMSKIDPSWKERQKTAAGSDETRLKVKELTKIAMHRPEVQVKMHASRPNNRIGYQTSEETKQKIRDTLKRKHAARFSS